MQTFQSGYRGLNLLMKLNSDLLLYVATLSVALAAGAWLGSL